ncbi:hypothetical protein BX600DRAFT_182641 [Xylariales sp. PMI_506]|nr:hypothetical protein BX600DRAFT_182641 [Xylariales sp. PMI_506]
MNNEQFRRLVASNTPKPSSSNSNGAPVATPRTVALGSKQKSSIPMTPRAVNFSKSDFQRQLAEQNQAERPQKKHKSSAPKGSKLAQGYTDRAKAREEITEDDRLERLNALEESFKKEEIDQATYERLRSQVAGGDLESTHLVKGLDFKLLERIRKGEDVYNNEESKNDDSAEDVDDALDQLEETGIEAVQREATSKKGQLATGTTLKPGQKRSRAMILAELKASREAAKAKEESALGSKFKKIGAKAPGTRIERDSKGREVLIIVDEDGHEKRKVRKVEATAQGDIESDYKARGLLMPDKNAKPLGMEVPEIYKSQVEAPEDDGDVDIFDDVGDDYDPLAGLGDDDSDEEDPRESEKTAEGTERETTKSAMPPPPRPAAEPRNYFKDSKVALASSQTLQAPSMSDPAILAALKKAASLNIASKSSEDDDEEAKAKAERHRRMLQAEDRDAQDMDMGFGTSRFEDEADFDDTDVKLSQWGNDDEDDAHGGGDGKKKRKRAPKKRKGDVNNAADVLRVMEQRKAAQ